MKYHSDLTCYCEDCCQTATAWWWWESLDGSRNSGKRYWTLEAAKEDQPDKKLYPVLARIHPDYPYESPYDDAILGCSL